MEHPRITRNPDVMLGKPCIRGTRVTVEHLLRELSGGSTHQFIAENYGVDVEDVAAALAFAADYLRRESLIAA